MMKALLLTAAASLAGPASASPALPAFQWHYRVIVSFATNAAQAKTLSDTFQQTPGISERQIAWFVVGPEHITSNLDPTDVPTRASLEKLHDSQTAETVLIGKDGSVKVRQHGALHLRALFATIDQMPMRQREMREQQQ